MTLYRQIVLMTSLLFLVLLLIVISLQLSHTRDYLARQMASDVQNTVTSLGLSLLQPLGDKDSAAVESVVNVVFDGGYYLKISVNKPDGSVLFERQADQALASVPAWFTDLDLFEPVTEGNILTRGWMQLGALYVTGHPGYAYQQLWKQVSELLVWFVGAFISVIIALVYGLRYLLWPLGQLQQRAQAIEHQQFGEPLPEPRISELNGLVGAFNSMSATLRKLFDEQAEEAEALRQQAYSDPLTGIANRTLFSAQLQQWLAEPGDGALVVIGTRGLSALQAEAGFEARDQVMLTKVEIVDNAIQPVPGALLARLSRSELALILPGLDHEQVAQLATGLIDEISSALSLSGADHLVRTSLGVVYRQGQLDPTELLSQADLALQQAGNNPHKRIQFVHSGDNEPILGRDRWRQLAVDAIEQGRFGFKTQPELAFGSGHLLGQELLTSIVQGNECYHAAQFMPFVDQYQLGSRLDRAILEAVEPALSRLEQPLTVNLSESAVADSAFATWLEGYLARLGGAVQYLSFDIPEEALVRAPDQLKSLAVQLRRHRVRFGFDRLGLHLERLRELAKLGPAYFKVDSALVLGHDTHADNFFKALARMSHTQQIQLILTRIENPQQLEQLQGMPVDGYQGFIAPPEPWVATH